jgi:hypothetical protein
MGQIAHLDSDRSNRSEDNLGWMCLEHHSTYDSKTKQHKNYTMREVKAARAKLYALVANGQHLTAAAALPHQQAEADRGILRNFLKIVPSNGSINFLRGNDFGFSFRRDALNDLEVFFYERGGPDYEFLDVKLEAARQRFRRSCQTLFKAIAVNTFPAHSSDLRTVPDEWEIEQPTRFHEALNAIHKGADAVCDTYDKLVRLAREKLAV